MDKIDAIPFFDVAQQFAVLGKMQCVPADMGNFQASRDSALHGNDAALQQTQALMLTKFIAFFKEHLHA